MPFLVCAYSDIDKIDLSNFTGSLETYIKDNEPDIVVIMYSVHQLIIDLQQDCMSSSRLYI